MNLDLKAWRCMQVEFLLGSDHKKREPETTKNRLSLNLWECLMAILVGFTLSFASFLAVRK